MTHHDTYGFGNGVKKGEGSATVQVVVVKKESKMRGSLNDVIRSKIAGKFKPSYLSTISGS